MSNLDLPVIAVGVSSSRVVRRGDFELVT